MQKQPNLLFNPELLPRIGWLAGFFDGEGFASLSKNGSRYTPEISMANTDLASLEYARSVLAEVGIYSFIGGKVERPEDKVKWKPCYRLRGSVASDCLLFTNIFIPYCITKKIRLILLQRFLNLKLHAKYGDSMNEEQLKIIEQLKEENRRGK